MRYFLLALFSIFLMNANAENTFSHERNLAVDFVLKFYPEYTREQLLLFPVIKVSHDDICSYMNMESNCRVQATYASIEGFITGYMTIRENMVYESQTEIIKVFVHETVHHIQHISGRMFEYECALNSEVEAYTVANMYLESVNRDDLKTQDYVIDRFKVCDK